MYLFIYLFRLFVPVFLSRSKFITQAVKETKFRRRQKFISWCSGSPHRVVY